MNKTRLILLKKYFKLSQLRQFFFSIKEKFNLACAPEQQCVKHKSTIEGRFKVMLCNKGVRHREKAISRSDECYYNPIILINDLLIN